MPGRRRGPMRSTRASAMKQPTPQPDPSDEEMADAPSGTVTPAEPVGNNDDEDAEPDYAEDDAPASSPAAESDAPTPSRTRASRSQAAAAAEKAVEKPPTPPPVPIKRGPGRPPKNRPVDWDASDHAGSDGTPKRRGGFRGRAFGGGRWKNRGGPQRVTQVPVDNEGNMATVRDDEVELPDDPEGEKKVDKLGYLKGGREYRVRTFTIGGRGERLYMLSTEPARCIGFRDSYLFFQKHKQLFKIIINDDEKRDLIDRDLMPHSYKGRVIGVVTARSVFREFGAAIIIGGKRVIDDYQVAAAKAEGAVEGEIAVPTDILPPLGQDYNRNQYVAWHGASAVYHSGAPTVPMQNSKDLGKKRKVTVTGNNWKYEHALAASRFNARLGQIRREGKDGIYDIYTNQMHYPANTQPTHAKWVEVVDSTTQPMELLSIDGKEGEQPPENEEEEGNGAEKEQGASSGKKETIFSPVSEHQRRNALTVDVTYVNPTFATHGPPGPEGIRRPYLGQLGMLDVPDDVAALLPEECRKPFEEQRERERQWHSQFQNETVDGHRGELRHNTDHGPILDLLYNHNAR